MNSRTSMAQREEIIRRTVYVSDIDQQVYNCSGLPLLFSFTGFGVHQMFDLIIGNYANRLLKRSLQLYL